MFSHVSSQNQSNVQTSDTCSTNKIDTYLKLTEEFATKGPNHLTDQTGCYPPCRRNEFEVKNIYSGVNFVEKLNGSLTLELAYFGTEYHVKEEYLAYGYPDLVADFGGYLGLLLGYSLLSLYDVGSKMFRKCTWNKSAENRLIA